VDLPAIRQWVRDMRDAGGSRSALSNRLSTLAVLLDDARAEGLSSIDGAVARHPAVRRELPDGPMRSPQTILTNAFATLLDALTTPLVWAVRYGLAGLAGLEDGAIAGLRISDLEVENGIRVLAIRRSVAVRGPEGWASEAPTKNAHRGTEDAPRWVPVHRALGVLLDRWLDEYVIWTGHAPRSSDWLLPQPNGRPWRPRSAEQLREHLEAAGITVPTDFGVHRLRGCFMSWLAAAGVAEDVRKRLAGHAGGVQEKHYLGRLALLPTDHGAVELIPVETVRVPVRGNELSGPNHNNSAGILSHLRDLNSRPTVYEFDELGRHIAQAPITGANGRRLASLINGTNAANVGDSTRVGPRSGPRADGEFDAVRAAEDLRWMVLPFEAAEAFVLGLEGGAP
jgi:integrase